MSSHEMGDTSSANIVRNQLAITVQLYKQIASMSHIDDMFLWLSHAMLQLFDIQGVQWWSLQAYRTGQYATRLRSMAYQNTAIPQYVVLNDHISGMIEHLQTSQNNFLYLGVNRLFSANQADLFARYGMYYCACYFLRKPTLLVPTRPNAAPSEIPTPLIATLLLFTQHNISQNVLAAINMVLEQAVAIAESHGLLTPMNTSAATPTSVPSEPPNSQTSFTPFPPSNSAPAQPVTPRNANFSALMPTFTPPQHIQPAASVSNQPTSPMPVMGSQPPKPASTPMPPPARPRLAPMTTQPLKPPTPPPAHTIPTSARQQPTAPEPARPKQPDQSRPASALQSALKGKTGQRAIKTQLDLFDLIPRHAEQTINIINNPLVGNAVIPDKQAKRLYDSIDGKRSLEEICLDADMDVNFEVKRIRKALRFLLIQKRIQLFEPNGQLVDSTPFLKE
ncbi:hypothetical protein EPA93_23590 [Ktedonosporobacter rubrisoli]|uniref:Uncharacterized protein n=1 Tax=Ktedonosporobacter rubrisoli TaxID=2509675 RepID=A0A4P6JV33_KTERU|nr:hypothetical protein [Ktedonosporobacter rubrisoli]QBD78806.1 hypothetical protein EPA93_23590 [Ktedonosporobacter rubrisoli]